MNKNILSNKGVISVNYVILILIGVIIAVGFLNIIAKTMSINEIQGHLDKAGVIALRYGVDETQWRLEKLVIDEEMAKDKFREVVGSSINPGRDRLLKSFYIRELNIYPPNHPGLKKLGIPSDKEREQYYIESVAEASYGSNKISDNITVHTIQYFDFLNTNNVVKKQITTSNEGGESKIIVRSVSRLVLR